jgi:hypothetical protein
MVRALLAICLACLASAANGDNLDFSATTDVIEFRISPTVD